MNEELRLQRRDGSQIWVLENSVLTEDPETGEAVNEGTLIDITDRKRLEEGLRHQALHDPLTELANRTLLADRVEQGLNQARRYERPMGLLMLDVDHFKRINDRLGHVAGDQVLKEIARRLEETVREEDTVARWGGDEFAVVLPELAEPGAIEEVLGRVREAVRSPIQSRGEAVHVNFSIGAVIRGDGEHPRVVEIEDSEELLRFASLALHWAKEDAPGGFSLFDPNEEVEGAARIQQESKLRDALDRGEIVPYYQPVVRLEDQARVGVEALARWQHPERGLVSPAEFIPMAEELGLISSLQEAIICQGCRDVAHRETANSTDSPVVISFNVSGQQFRDPKLAESFQQTVEDAEFDPQQVIIEVTETSLMQVPTTIDRLRSLGFRVFIDDFGTGYSTFTYLRELEVDGLKIDMSFVQGIVESDSDAALSEAMVTLGERLGLTVIAEGIETEGQRRRLQDLGCSLGQGFLFAKPMRGDELSAEWLTKA